MKQTEKKTPNKQRNNQIKQGKERKFIQLVSYLVSFLFKAIAVQFESKDVN